MERMRWFTGRFMTARDLRDEQRFHVGRRQLHNRLFHGHGVVCGLVVSRNARRECSTWVWIESGIALDCCGRELINERRAAFSWPLPESPTAPPAYEEVVLCMVYDEVATECAPTIIDDCCGPLRNEPSRIRESVRFELRSPDELPGCWPQPGPSEPVVREDCDDSASPIGCLEPLCPCGGCVPLALLSRQDGGEIEIDRLRPTTNPPADFLTHIARLNWTHGGTVTLDELAADGGRLVVEFDRRVDPGDDSFATGINRFTFRGEYGGLEEELEFLPCDSANPPQLQDGTKAVFTIRDDFWRSPPRSRRSTLAGQWVYVTLLCDFIVDCHGNAVDGQHLRGRVPTGDGTPGGTFRSWFWVSDSRDEDRKEQGEP
jgi:hypothetical protein